MSDPGVPDRLFDDTWEHTERESMQRLPLVPLPSKLESFVIVPITVRQGQRATGTLILSAPSDMSLVVLLAVAEDVLLFDPPVISSGAAAHALQFPPGIRSLQFRFRDKADGGIPLGTPIEITATLGDSILAATVTITP